MQGRYLIVFLVKNKVISFNLILLEKTVVKFQKKFKLINTKLITIGFEEFVEMFGKSLAFKIKKPSKSID